MKKIIIFLIISFMFSSNPVFSQTEETDTDPFCKDNPDDCVEMEPEEPCGLSVKMKDGKFSSIKACGEADIKGKYTRRKMRKAKQRGTMRAKAKIAHFMNEEITSEETYEAISKSLTTELNEELTEMMEEIETQTETLKTNAKALLKGVKVIEVIPEDDGVIVWVGINLKTMKAADSLKYNIEKDHAEEEREADMKKGSSGSSSDSSNKKSKKKYKAKRKKSADADEF